MLFTFLQSDLRKKMDYETHMDLKKSVLKFVDKDDCRKMLSGVNCLNIVAEYSNKKFSNVFDADIAKIFRTEYRSGEPSLRFLEKPTHSFYWVHTFPEFSPLIEDFNDMLGRIVAIGITGNWNFFAPFSKKPGDDIGPQVLTMDHLTVGFIACFCPLGVAILTFIMEIIVHKLSVSANSIILWYTKAFYSTLHLQSKNLLKKPKFETKPELNTLTRCKTEASLIELNESNVMNLEITSILESISTDSSQNDESSDASSIVSSDETSEIAILFVGIEKSLETEELEDNFMEPTVEVPNQDASDFRKDVSRSNSSVFGDRIFLE